ncbi:hypothetical protein [Agromyces kandeliae]|uniref:Uncharacterized protein n=1 Tax=Agromyces kandeliae TaxID=2666141 RepID=A0A6L5QWR5_9MICO|nr:hypothetical protein [Agromyces kandeliae]MRX42125.1 hypothetical protein [Agromyces kandeliae]
MSDRSTASLLAGRSSEALDDREVRRVATTFLGLDGTVVFEYDESGYTRFVVEQDEDGADYGKVYFGRDIYPGRSVIDPNSALSMPAAVAHEISHVHRWRDRTELPLGSHRHVDEALTSMDAALRFANQLSPHDIQQLIRDATQRLQMHVRDLDDESSAEGE